jgi:hypothetical protein
VTTPIPGVINAYFELENRRDHEALLALFADDATVTDEGQTRHGREEIRDWRNGSPTRYSYTIELAGVQALTPDRYLAQGRLTGDFPGGTADLSWEFTIDHGRITRLVIAP